MNLKSSLYAFLRLWNDLDAIRKCRIGKRLQNKLIGRVAGRMMRK